jgi:hypothetical protein
MHPKTYSTVGGGDRLVKGGGMWLRMGGFAKGIAKYGSWHTETGMGLGTPMVVLVTSAAAQG